MSDCLRYIDFGMAFSSLTPTFLCEMQQPFSFSGTQHRHSCLHVTILPLLPTNLSDFPSLALFKGKLVFKSCHRPDTHPSSSIILKMHGSKRSQPVTTHLRTQFLFLQHQGLMDCFHSTVRFLPFYVPYMDLVMI